MKKGIISISVIVTLLISCFTSLSVIADTTEIPDIPEPVKVVDFSNSFEELALTDEKFEVVDNAAKPELVLDEEMGQVLKLGKAVIKTQYYRHDINLDDVVNAEDAVMILKYAAGLIDSIKKIRAKRLALIALISIPLYLFDSHIEFKSFRNHIQNFFTYC